MTVKDHDEKQNEWGLTLNKVDKNDNNTCLNEYSLKQLYKSNCNSCNKKYEIYTQKDCDPEYYTDIYVKCDCSNLVHFCLPVN